MMDRQTPFLLHERQSELCLGIDLGTGGPKVALVTLDGEVLCHEVHHVATDFGADGAATQDADEWWSLVTESTGACSPRRGSPLECGRSP